MKDALLLLRYSLFGGEEPAISDWSGAARDLHRHALLPLISAGPCPAEKRGILENIRFQNQAAFLRHCFAAKELNRVLAPGKAVILKGLSAALYYKDPSLRTMGDIDFLVLGIPVEEADQRLREAGYSSSNAVCGDLKARHIAYEKSGVHYELHRYFSGGRGRKGKRLDARILGAEPVERKLGGAEFYSLPDPENALVILAHIAQHLRSELGLRQLADWACLVDRLLTDEFWEANFSRMTREAGLKALAITATRMVEKYFGGPHRVFAESANEKTVDLLFEELDGAGNFGRSRETMANKIAEFQTERNPFRRLQKCGLHAWPYAQKHAWARPFAWIYQVFRIFGMLIRNQGGKERKAQVKEMVKRRRILFRALKIR